MGRREGGTPPWTRLSRPMAQWGGGGIRASPCIESLRSVSIGCVTPDVD